MMQSRRMVRCGVSAVFFLAFALPCCAWAISPEEFERLPKDRQKAVLVEAVERNVKRYENISLKTTSRIQGVNVNLKTKEIAKTLEDFGTNTFELRRMGPSYRVGMTRKPARPNTLSPQSTDHYNAETGINRSVASLPGRGVKGQEHGTISSEQTEATFACRYGAYLGLAADVPAGKLIFSGGEEHRVFDFLLQHRDTLEVRGVDRRAGLVETCFTYKREVIPSGTCTQWFDLNKDWMIVRRVWEWNDGQELGYERLEVKETKRFDGVWMPTRFIVTHVNVPVGKTAESSFGNLWEVTAENIKFGGVKPVDLEVVFLAGTLVRNEITGEKWTVGKSGEKLPYNDTVVEGPTEKAVVK